MREPPKITIARNQNGDMVAAADATSGDIMFCPSCNYQVRAHKQRVPHGPRDHFEHLVKGRCLK